MNQLTYKEAETRIFDAYFKDEIKPFDANFCFCGTLCNNSSKWFGSATKKHYPSHGYVGHDFVRMEKSLWSTLVDTNGIGLYKDDTIEYEEALFNGMSAALDVLKQIHISRGEIIDEPITFKKRELKMEITKF